MNKLENVLSNIPYGILIEDDKRKINIANDEFVKILSIPLPAMELKGLNFVSIAKQIKDLFLNPAEFEDFMVHCVDGEQKSLPTLFSTCDNRFIEIRYLPYYIEGMLKGHSWCFNDVTNNVNNVRELEQQKEFFYGILNSIPADVAIFDSSHRYLFINQKAVQNKEIRKFLIGKDDFDYCRIKEIGDDMAHYRRQKFNEMVSSGQSKKWEDIGINEQGDETSMLRIMHPVYKDDKLEFVIGYGIDISEVKLKDLKLREEERKSNELIGKLKEVVFNIDVEGRFETINPAWETLTGFTADSTIGAGFNLYILDDRDRKLINDFLVDKEAQDFKAVIRVRTQTDFKWMDAYVSKKISKNRVVGYWGTLSDITDSKKFQDDVLENLRKEIELNELKSQFVNMVSHEVRTPLAGILSSVELLEIINQNMEEPNKTKCFNHFSRIKGQILRLGDLMNDVLMLGKIEAGKVYLNLRKEPVAEIIPAFIMDSFNAGTDGPQISVKVTGNPFAVNLDWNIMKHILVNLISNAVKYSTDSKLPPEVEIVFLSRSLKINVKDYGIGIPKKDMERLFNPFNRASNVGHITGTGLGLILVKHFIKMHKGNVKVKSKVGMGSIFSITIPKNLV